MYCVNEMLFASLSDFLMWKYISAWKFIEGILVMGKEELHIHKDLFACLFSIHNIISLSCPEQVCLSGLRFERYFPIIGQCKSLCRAYLK